MPRRLSILFLSFLVLAGGAGYTLIGAGRIQTQIDEERTVNGEPVRLIPGKGLYTLLLSARIAPGAAGGLRVALEGVPGMNYSLFNLTPLLNPAQQDGPQLRQNRIELPKTAARLELGIVLQPKPPAPVDARSHPELPACCRGAGQLGHSSLATVADYDRPLQLRFYDARSGRLVLKIPILVGDRPQSETDLNDLFRPDQAPPTPARDPRS